MLHFLSALFSNAGRIQGQPDKALIDAAIERVVDGTDRRLRGLTHYRRRLRPAVERAVIHIAAIVDALPEAVEISAKAYRSDPHLRAFFVSPKHLQEVIADFSAVKEYLKTRGEPMPEFLYGCLSMDYREKKTLGTEMTGDILQRDVPQVTVSFFDHRYVGPSDNAMAARYELENRGFDFLIEKALETMVVTKSQRVELEQHRRILSRKLDAMRAGDWGMEPILAPDNHSQPDIGRLEQEIEQLDTQLIEMGSTLSDLAQRLDYLVSMFNQAEEWLSMDSLVMNLDAMMVKRDTAEKGVNSLKFNLVKAKSGERRIIVLGYFPTAELPAGTDFFKEAGRYLD